MPYLAPRRSMSLHVYRIFTGLSRKGMLFCSSMIFQTLKGRHRTSTPARRGLLDAHHRQIGVGAAVEKEQIKLMRHPMTSPGSSIRRLTKADVDPHKLAGRC